MAIPKFEDFLYPFLLQLKDKDVSSKEMKEKLIGHFGLTDEDRQLKTKGGSAFQIDDRIGWCRQWLRRALFIDIPQKGIYHITKRGSDYLKSHSDLRQNDLLEYPEYATYAGISSEIRNDENGEDDSSSDEWTPTEQLEAAMKIINDDLAADLLQKSRKTSQLLWKQLEYYRKR